MSAETRQNNTYDNKDGVFMIDRPFLWNVHDGQQALEMIGRHEILRCNGSWGRKEVEKRRAEGTQSDCQPQHLINSRRKWSANSGTSVAIINLASGVTSETMA